MAKKKAAREKLLTRPELAVAMGVTPGTITRWENDGMPVAKKTARGRYTMFSLAAVQAWRDSIEAAGSLSLSEERAKLAQSQREKIDLELSVRRGELVATEDVVRQGQAQVKGWTAKLRTLPQRAVQLGVIQPAQLGGLDALIRDVIDDIRGFKIETRRSAS